METENRGLGYDIFSRYRGELMGFAMVWVLLFHTFHLGLGNSWLRDLRDLGFFGVDIFIFLSALGLSLSLSRRKQSYGAYLRRRLVRVLPTYWLVTGLYGLALRLAGEASLRSVAWTMSTLFYWFQKPNYFNWYIPGLLVFYLLEPPLTALLVRCRRRELVTAGLCLLAFPLYHLTQLHGLAHIGDVILRLPVFCLGTLVGLDIAQGRELTPRRLWVWAVLPFLVPVAKSLAPPYYLPNCLSFAFGCVALCLLLAGLTAVLAPLRVDRVLRLLGECSLEIYLLNVVFVREYDRLSALIPLGYKPLICYAVTVPVNILLGVGLHYALKGPMAWLTAKVTGSGSPSRPPKEGGCSAGDQSGR